MNTKRIISLLVATILTCTCFIGCSTQKPPAATSAPVSSGSVSAPADPEPAADPKPAADPIVMKLATVGAPGDSLVTTMEYFAKEIEKRSNGAIKAEVYHSSQLGAHRDYIDGLQMGSIQMAEIASSVVALVDPAFMIFDMPYISANEEEQRQTLKDGAGSLLNDSLISKTNIAAVGWLCRTPRNVYSSKEPINTVDDFNGLLIRTMESPPMLRAMELLGAKATPIPSNERYMALQTKVVDAAENNSGEIYSKKEYEVTKYLSKTAHIIQPNVLCVDNNWLSSLPQDLQDLVWEVGYEAGEYGTQFDFDNVAAIEEKLVSEGGMVINDIPDKSEFVAALQPLYEEYKDEIGADIFAAFQK